MIATGNGDIGIGVVPSFRLDIRKEEDANFVAQIYNTDTGSNTDGLKLRLGKTESLDALIALLHFLMVQIPLEDLFVVLEQVL